MGKGEKEKKERAKREIDASRRIMKLSLLFYSCLVDARNAPKLAWMDQLSSSEDCGMEIRSTDKNSGFIESTHYYMKEGEDRLKCKWEISTECDAIESIFDDIKLSDRKEIEEVEKVFYCLSDNVQVTSGDYATKKYCAFDDSNDYDDEDFNKLYDDPSGGTAMDWNLIDAAKFTIKYQTKHL